MKIYEIYFSPTGGTKNTADILTSELGNDIIAYDITKENKEVNNLVLTKDDITVIAVPSFGGRVPSTAIKRISEIKGNGAFAVLLCVYGNRAYEDTLAELYDTVKANNFNVIAAVSAVAEHSIVRQIAANRPDEIDKKQLTEFAKKIYNKFSTGKTNEFFIPGGRPYKKYSNIPIIPKPTKACTKCGLCSKECPVQAIDKNNPKKVDSKICISCMRCISVCPNNARKINSIMLFVSKIALSKVCSKRKECELFI